MMLSIAREDKRLGVFGLFRGIASPIATAAPLNGLVFASYRGLLALQNSLEDGDDRKPYEQWTPTLAQIAIAGMGCGVISSIITTPTELVKIRQQAPGNTAPNTKLPSAREVAHDIFRRHGIRGLYRGITATALRDLGYGSYFFAYEATCRYLPYYSRKLGFTGSGGGGEAGKLVHEMDHQAESGWVTLLLAGGVAGIAGWIFTFPMDVIKTRVQATEGGYYMATSTLSAPSPAPLLSPTPALATASAHSHLHGYMPSHASTSTYPQYARAIHNMSTTSSSQTKELNPYRSTFSTFLHSYRSEGGKVFFRGLWPTLVRAIPVNMATFAVFEGVAAALL